MGRPCCTIGQARCGDRGSALKPTGRPWLPDPAPSLPLPAGVAEAESIKFFILTCEGRTAPFHLNWSEFALTPGEFCLP